MQKAIEKIEFEPKLSVSLKSLNNKFVWTIEIFNSGDCRLK